MGRRPRPVEAPHVLIPIARNGQASVSEPSGELDLLKNTSYRYIRPLRDDGLVEESQAINVPGWRLREIAGQTAPTPAFAPRPVVGIVRAAMANQSRGIPTEVVSTSSWSTPGGTAFALTRGEAHVDAVAWPCRSS